MSKLELKQNSVVGSWRLEKQLGEGGQAQVWGVRYLKDKHSVPGALKICTDQSPKARSRFAQEISLLRAQDHPGIVKVRDSGEYQGSPFFVMERATTTLHHVTAATTTGTRLICDSRELLLRFLRQACSAVAHLHDHKIIHRDLKPSNVLLMLDPTEPSRAVVADLGIASVDQDQGQLTATHESIGTPSFRAPEALTGLHTFRSDVYSLGKTIEAVVNNTAILGIGPAKCRRDMLLADDLWEALDHILEKACDFDPMRRYGHAKELVDEFPVVVLAQSSCSTRRIVSAKVTTVLSVPERVALSEVIGACPAPGDHVALSGIQRESSLSMYQFALAIRRLETLGFVENGREEDHDGEPYAVVGPTSEGVAWAHGHEADMDAAIAAAKGDVDYGDIPF